MPDRVTMARDWRIQADRLMEPSLDAAALVVAQAQRQAIPVSRDGSHGRPAGYARSRISVQRGRDALGSYRDVGSDALTPDGFPYPRVLDLGSRPHVIESKGNYPLRDRYGRVFGRRVQHPGTKPTAWCRGSLEALRGRTFYL